MAEQKRQSSLTREQKTGFVLLLVFGLLAVGFGFLQMRNTIYQSLCYPNSRKQSGIAGNAGRNNTPPTN